MNAKTFFLALSLLCLVAEASAQLTLERIDGKRTAHIRDGRKISVKTVQQSSLMPCDSYLTTVGTFKLFRKDTVWMVAQSQRFLSNLNDTVWTKQETEFRYGARPPLTAIPAAGLLEVVKYRRGGKKRDDWGGALMLVSAFHALFIGPIFSGRERRASDLVAFGTLGMGTFLLALPNKKVYKIQQGSSTEGRTWQIRR